VLNSDANRVDRRKGDLVDTVNMITISQKQLVNSEKSYLSNYKSIASTGFISAGLSNNFTLAS